MNIGEMSIGELAVFGLFLVLASWAAISDLRSLTIPNRICLALMVLWFATWRGPQNAIGPMIDMGLALLIFLMGLAAFSRGLLGGGDVKLLAAGTLWAGHGFALEFFTYTFVAAGVLALTILSPIAQWLAFYNPLYAGVPPFRRRVPLAVAIAAGLIPAGLNRLVA